MSGHTPGPWRFDRDWRRIPTIFGADGRQMIATVEKHKHLPNGCGMQEDLPEREGNARLIAAAPDMLAALREAEIGLAHEVELHKGLHRRMKLAIVRDAISKATGITLHV